MSAVAVESRELPEHYRDAVELVAHARTGRLLDQKKVANNTWAVLEHPDGEVLDAPDVVIRLHSTGVVRFRPDGTVTLDSGGWRSVTTKARINKFAPGVQVYQRSGQWFMIPTRLLTVGDGGLASEIVRREVERPFFDGITYRPDTGEVVEDVEAEAAAVDRAAAEVELRRRVKEFVRLAEDPERNRDLIAAVVEGGNWAGDCWYCLMRDEQGVPLGDSVRDAYHLEAHLQDEYLVPSLFRNAFQEHYSSPSSGDQRLWMWAVDLQGGLGVGSRHEIGTMMGNYFVKRLLDGRF